MPTNQEFEKGNESEKNQVNTRMKLFYIASAATIAGLIYNHFDNSPTLLSAPLIITQISTVLMFAKSLQEKIKASNEINENASDYRSLNLTNRQKIEIENNRYSSVENRRLGKITNEIKNKKDSLFKARNTAFFHIGIDITLYILYSGSIFLTYLPKSGLIK